MPWAASDLDFAVVDRASTLGDLLKLLFALLEAFGPKDVADLLTTFDASIVVDPETAGRWLRNERRPSKPHLRLIVRLLQSRGLVGSPPARDRLFMRMAAFYAKLEAPQLHAILPAPRTSGFERPQVPGMRFWGLRQHYELALALQNDLDAAGEGTPRLDARQSRPRPRPPMLLPPILEVQRMTSFVAPRTKTASPLFQRFRRTLLTLFRAR